METPFFMENVFHGNDSNYSMEFHGNCIFHRISMENVFHGIPWKTLHGIPWNSMPNTRQNSMEKVPWNSMEFHGVILHGVY